MTSPRVSGADRFLGARRARGTRTAVGSLAILLLIGHFYANREAVNVGNIVTQMPLAVDALMQPYRRVMV